MTLRSSAGMCRPGLRHQRQERDRLQRDGLAARIRPGDDEDAEPLAQRDVDRHDLACQQRVPRGDEIEPERRVCAFGRLLRCVVRRPEARGVRAHLGGETRLGEREINRREAVHRPFQRVRLLGDECGERLEDALDLVLLVIWSVRQRLFISTASSGSTKSVCPLAEVSWTTPGTWLRDRPAPARRAVRPAP